MWEQGLGPPAARQVWCTGSYVCWASMTYICMHACMLGPCAASDPLHLNKQTRFDATRHKGKGAFSGCTNMRVHALTPPLGKRHTAPTHYSLRACQAQGGGRQHMALHMPQSTPLWCARTRYCKAQNRRQKGLRTHAVQALLRQSVRSQRLHARTHT